ncbi:MAG TPA: S9 family peptidase [Bacteroidota bacterium]|nr:S9 family peptidase [Bacteroidota bacterium]
MQPIYSCYMSAVILLLPSIALPQNARKVFTPDDVRKIVRLSDPQISPDGGQVAVVVSRPEWESDKNKEEIDLVNVSDGTLRSVTFERKSISEVQWSPDGGKLAFIAKGPDSDETQIYVMTMNGGDPVPITESKTGVKEFTWSPDGTKIAFVAQDTIPNPKEIKHHEDAFKVSYNNYLVRAELQPWHLWIVSSKGGKAEQLTKGDVSLCTDQETISPLSWSKNGSAIVFQQFPDVWDGNAWHSTIMEVDTSGSEARALIEDEGSGHPQYAPGTELLSFMRPRNGDQNNGNAVYLRRDGKNIDITQKLDRNIDNYLWLPDAASVLIAGEKGSHSIIWRQPIDGDAEQIDLGNVEVESQSISVSNNGILAFTGATSEHPSELYLLQTLSAKPRRLTDVNSFADSLDFGKTVTVDWKGPDGFDEDGILTYPVEFKKGQKYPLVLVIHGGPESASTVEFSPLPELLATEGFFVFQPNYRGSTNLGDEYQHAIFKDTGEGPGKDVMAGLDKILQLNVIDTNRVGVSGWSYGGYMTSWLTGYYPTKWKAAVEGAALNDWVMDYTIAYYQKGDLYFFGGSPWVDEYWNIWREQSPIVLAKNVKAPTLIMGDAGDDNVPIVNSYEMYHALLDNGVQTAFYVYPVDTHFPGDIVRRTDVYKRWIDWMKKFLQ